MLFKWFSRIVSFVLFLWSLLGIRIGPVIVPTQPAEMIRYDAKNTTAIVSLESNPSTGYGWEYDVSDPLVVTVAGDRFIDGNSGGMVGAPGTREVSFKGLAAGTATVTFRYLRSWEGEPVRTVVLQLTVAADKTLTASLVSDTAAQAA